VLLENEFASGADSSLMSAQLRSRVLTLASPTTEGAERRTLVTSIIANLGRYATERTEPSAILLAAPAVEAMRWTFGGRLPRRDGFIPLSLVRAPTPDDEMLETHFWAAYSHGRENQTPTPDITEDAAWLFDSTSRVRDVLLNAARAAEEGGPVCGGLVYAPVIRPGVGRIFVTTLTGGQLRFDDIQASDSVASVKAKIQDAQGIPLDQQRLICLGQQMGDSRATLGDYGIQPALPEQADDEVPVVRLVLRLRGGCCTYSFIREVTPAPNTRVLATTAPVQVRVSLTGGGGDCHFAFAEDAIRRDARAFEESYEVSVVKVRRTVRARALCPTPRVLRWDRDELRGFFHVMAHRAPELLRNEDLRWRLLESLALPVEEWESEIPGSRVVAVRRSEPSRNSVAMMEQLMMPPGTFNDVCFTASPPAGGWSPGAHYRVEMSLADPTHRAHSYSFFASDVRGEPDSPQPMTASGGVMNFSY
jgi:hypothetical protein